MKNKMNSNNAHSHAPEIITATATFLHKTKKRNHDYCTAQYPPATPARCPMMFGDYQCEGVLLPTHNGDRFTSLRCDKCHRAVQFAQQKAGA